ncbi:MAG: GAF domain-containing protein [Chlorobium sp.]
MVSIVVDITGHKQVEDELYKLNRALLAISNCSQVLLRAENEMELLHDICRIVVEVGGYRMAWVGYAENDTKKSVRPVAQDGFEDGYLETLMISWADVERGRGPTGSAIRTGEPCSTKNILLDTEFTLWRQEAIKRGYTSMLSLPLKANDEVFGALSIYSPFLDAFNAEETKLLSSLAGNLAYGITMLRNLKARKLAEDELRQSETRYRSLFQNKQTVMLIIDPKDGRIVDANPAAEIFYGWEQAELCQMKITQINLRRYSQKWSWPTTKNEIFLLSAIVGLTAQSAMSKFSALPLHLQGALCSIPSLMILLSARSSRKSFLWAMNGCVSLWLLPIQVFGRVS